MLKKYLCSYRDSTHYTVVGYSIWADCEETVRKIVLNQDPNRRIYSVRLASKYYSERQELVNVDFINKKVISRTIYE